MFRKSIEGRIDVEFTSASPEEILEAASEAGIPLYAVRQIDELTCQIGIRHRDFRHLSRILNRRGAGLRILNRSGIYWSVKTFLNRPILIGCFLLLLILSVYLPTRVLFVSVEGNTKLPGRLILAAAEDCGVRFGASRKLVRSEQVKNRLLSSLPQLQWAGVNTRGCTAVISVRERMEKETETEDNLVTSLIADRDGYILSATVTRGTPMVVPGQSVTKGQLLVSGFTDCDFCIRATRAEGEILAQTNRSLKVLIPQKYAAVKSAQDTYRKISLLIGKKRINLWKDSRISHGSCGRMYLEYYVSLPGGFQLPLGISVDRYRDYTLEESRLSQEDARALLQQFSDGYVLRQMVAGGILQKHQELMPLDDLYLLKSSYVCREIIGRERREQIGVINGKRN